MGTITGGVVKFERRVKTGEFEHKHAAAEISFLVPEGEAPQATVDLAGAQAHGQVMRLLGLPAKAAAPTDKDRLAEAAGAPPKVNKKLPAPDAASMGDDVVTEQPAPTITSSKAIVEANAAAMVEDDEFTAAAAPVTDKDLGDLIRKRNEATNTNKDAIKVLIGKYAPAGARSSEIPQEKRAAFLAELALVPVLPK